jgi:hypothetical protein
MSELEQQAQQSAYNIQTYDLKNRKKFPYLPLRINEDFFEAPQLWRSFALQQEYYPPDYEVFPGKRTKPLNELGMEVFDSFAKSLHRSIPNCNGFRYLMARFHSVDETFVKGWIHDDDPKINLAGLVYLNENAPLGSGTSFYDDQIDNTAEQSRLLIHRDIFEFTPEQRSEISDHREAHRKKFTVNTVVENVFNRCITFDPRLWHAPDNFFGTTLEDSRLTLVFYAQVEYYG